MRLVVDAYCEVGPALLLDEQFVAGWAEATFDKAVLDQTFEHAAVRGECCYLKDQDARQLSGAIHFFIAEPAPALVKYATRQATALRLDLPTGKLRFRGLCALVKDGGLKPGEEDFLSLELAPGTWSVDLFRFVDQASRIEDEALLLKDESPLPGERPATRWTAPLRWLGLGLGVSTFLAVLFWLVFWRYAAQLGLIAAVLCGLWALRLAADRASGDRSRREHNAALWKEHLSRLPELPGYVVVLRPADPASPPGDGGGLM
jgi:hypothetical protein